MHVIINVIWLELKWIEMDGKLIFRNIWMIGFINSRDTKYDKQFLISVMITQLDYFI